MKICQAIGVLAALPALVVALPVCAVMPGRHCPRCAECLQEEIVYQDVVTHRCRLVPDVKQMKKTVYECKEVPFCLHKLPPLFSRHKHDCCDACPECDCPRYKKVLLKKEIVCEEICGTKCVIEEVIERVPCHVCRPCPHCSSAVPRASAAPLPPAPLVEPAAATVQFSDGYDSLLPPPPVPGAP
jgi:hypothetical protein